MIFINKDAILYTKITKQFYPLIRITSTSLNCQCELGTLSNIYFVRLKIIEPCFKITT